MVLRGFPTFVSKELARKCATDSQIQSLVERNVLWAGAPDGYCLVDEFLRVRLLLEAEDGGELEHRLLRRPRRLPMGEEEDFYFVSYDDDDDEE